MLDNIIFWKYLVFGLFFFIIGFSLFVGLLISKTGEYLKTNYSVLYNKFYSAYNPGIAVMFSGFSIFFGIWALYKFVKNDKDFSNDVNLLRRVTLLKNIINIYLVSEAIALAIIFYAFSRAR